MKAPRRIGRGVARCRRSCLGWLRRRRVTSRRWWIASRSTRVRPRRWPSPSSVERRFGGSSTDVEPDRSATGVLEAPPDDASRGRRAGSGSCWAPRRSTPVPSVVSSADATVVLSGTDDGGARVLDLDRWLQRTRQTTGRPGSSAALHRRSWRAAVRDDIWLAVGTDYEKLLADRLDIERWARVATRRRQTGLERHGDMNSVVATERGFVATGAYRTGADLGSGARLYPALWRSVDGARLGRDRACPRNVEGFALGVVAIGDRLLVAGGSGPSAVVWSSDDQGSSWSRTRPEAATRKAGPSHITSMAVAADGESSGA